MAEQSHSICVSLSTKNSKLVTPARTPSSRTKFIMTRVQGSLQRAREEQLQLRSQLSNVYNVVRDLGLHYEMKEISGCSFITIGRTKHNYSHLDKNLVRSVPRRASDEVQYAEHYRVISGDTVSNDEKDESILNLHKMNLEKEEEIKRRNLLLENLSSQLQAANCLANDEAENKKNLSRTVMEKNEETKRLNFQLSELSSTLQNADKQAANDAETKQNLSGYALKQEEEIQRLTLQLSNLSSTAQANNMKDEEIIKLNQKVERLSILLETCTATKNKAEQQSSTLEELKEYWREKVERSENTRISERDFANLNLQRQKAEICELNTLLKNSESKLSRCSEEIEEKDDKSAVISDQNRALNKKITKLLSKFEQQEEEHILQLAFQQNQTLKEALKEPSIAPIKGSNDGPNDPKIVPEEPSETPKMGQNDSAEDTPIDTPEDPQEGNPNEPEELEELEENQTWSKDDIKEIIRNLVLALAKKEDTIATAVFDFLETAYTDVCSHKRHDYNQALIGLIMSEDGLATIANILAETASAVENVDIITDLGGIYERDSAMAESLEAVSRILGQEIKASLPRLWKVLHDVFFDGFDKSSVPGNQLMKKIRKMIAKALSTFKRSALTEIDTWTEFEKSSEQEDIDAEDEEKSEDKDKESDAELGTTEGSSNMDKVCAQGLRTDAHAETLMSDENSDSEYADSENSEDSFEQDIYELAKFYEHVLEPATTSTPFTKMSKLLSDGELREIFSPAADDQDGLKIEEWLKTGERLKEREEDYIEEEYEFKGKDENPKENTNDSGLETSGYAISIQSKESDCNLLNINSTSSNPNEEASSTEWRPLRPKWHCKEDPNYFHCHQDSPELCDNCSMQWGHPLYLGMVWDGEEWV